MGHEEARKLWDVFDAMSLEGQAEYMNQRFGDYAYDASREWDEETLKEELEEIKIINKRIQEQKTQEQVSFANMMLLICIATPEEKSKIYDFLNNLIKGKKNEI